MFEIEETESRFDNLLSEDEYEIQTKPRQKVITDEEATFMKQKRYGDLVQKQEIVNMQIDQKLQQHEDDLRKQEEEFYEAKREAARVARQERAKRENQNTARKSDEHIKKLLDESAFVSWLSDDDDEISDHDLDTHDFEEFLAKVRNSNPDGAEAAMSSHPSDSLENDDEAANLAKQSLDALGRWSPAFDDD